jgi:hypothetical protein
MIHAMAEQSTQLAFSSKVIRQIGEPSAYPGGAYAQNSSGRSAMYSGLVIRL